MGYYIESSGRGQTTLADGEVVGPYPDRKSAQTAIDWKAVGSGSRCKPENYKVSFILEKDVVPHPKYRTFKSRRCVND